MIKADHILFILLHLQELKHELEDTILKTEQTEKRNELSQVAARPPSISYIWRACKLAVTR